MNAPRHLGSRELARSIGGRSAAEQLMDYERFLPEQTFKTHAFQNIGEVARNIMGSTALEQVLEQDRIDRKRMLYAQNSVSSSHRQATEMARLAELDRSKLLGSMTSAVGAARLAGYFDLPDLLEQYRQTDVALASRLVDLYQMPWGIDSHVAALSSHAALSDMLGDSGILGYDALSAIKSVLASPVPGLHSFRQASQFLNISGLLRFPRFRRLTQAEKTQRVKLLVRESAPSKQVKKAHSLVHQNERVLRAVITQCMEDAYGEDWAAERLPRCGCKKLLGKSLDDCEIILDQADYFHYIAIMSDPTHFEDIFSKGFESPEVIVHLVSRAGHLRHRSHHARTFTAEHLRELVAIWRAIEKGLIELSDDMVFDP